MLSVAWLRLGLQQYTNFKLVGTEYCTVSTYSSTGLRANILVSLKICQFQVYIKFHDSQDVILCEIILKHSSTKKQNTIFFALRVIV